MNNLILILILFIMVILTIYAIIILTILSIVYKINIIKVIKSLFKTINKEEYHYVRQGFNKENVEIIRVKVLKVNTTQAIVESKELIDHHMKFYVYKSDLF